jgi:nanoRNase/pAp phosphatase (c-di-AMP/oligoRNAs hydrolase)
MPLTRKLEETLEKLEKPVLISFHAVADADAIASGVALQQLIKPRADLKYISLNTQSKKILKELKIKIEKLDRIEKYNSIILVDVSDPEMLAGFKNQFEQFALKKKLVTIDHHETFKKIKKSLNYYSNATSCSEIIYSLYKKKNIKPSQTACFLMLLGLISDTDYFKEATPLTFQNASELLKNSGGNYFQALKTLKQCASDKQAENIIKALKKTIIENGVSITKTETHRTQCASILSNLTPLAIVQSKGRISMVQNTSCSNLNIGELAKKCALKFHGVSWGHENIGGCEVQDTEKAVEWLKKQLKRERLQSQNSSRATPSMRTGRLEK